MEEGDRVQYLFDDWKFDPVGGVLEKRNSEPLRIEPKASVVLRMLLEQAGEVVTIDHLLGEAWRSRVVEVNAVHKQISALRRALQDSSKSPRYLETISKIGYRFKILPERISGSPSAGAPETTPWSGIAVPPFSSDNNNAETSELAKGLREDLITELSRFTDLTVRAPGVQSGSDPEEMLQQASRLSVTHMLLGFLRADGDHHKITVRLCRTGDAVVIWSSVYHTKLRNLMEIRSDVTLKVAEAMSIELPQRLREAILKPSTASLNAYAHFVKSLYQLKERFDIVSALDELAKAIDIDPQFAAAIAQKAYLHSVITDNVGADPAATREQSEEFAELAAAYADQALALDKNQSHAYLARATIAQLNLQYTQRRDHLERAFELEPNDVSTSFELANQRFNVSRPLEAHNLIARALLIDPDNLAIPAYASFRSIWAEQWEYALEYSWIIVSKLPESPEGYALHALAAAYLERDDAREHLAHAASRLTNKGNASGKPLQCTLIWMMHAYKRLNEPARVEACAKQAQALGVECLDLQSQLLYNLACSDTEAVLALIERIVCSRFPPSVCRDLYHHRGHCFLDEVRDSRRFIRAMKRLSDSVDPS